MCLIFPPQLRGYSVITSLRWVEQIKVIVALWTEFIENIDRWSDYFYIEDRFFLAIQSTSIKYWKNFRKQGEVAIASIKQRIAPSLLISKNKKEIAVGESRYIGIVNLSVTIPFLHFEVLRQKIPWNVG